MQVKATFHIGLFGGMFDPVHNGHLAVSLDALHRFSLDEVRLLPCGVPAHRAPARGAVEDRLAMLELAVSGQAGLTVDGRECRSDAPSYTVHTLQAIKNENPDARLYFMVGMDAFTTLPSWYEWKAIFALTHLVVMERPGCERVMKEELKAEFMRRRVESFSRLLTCPTGNVLACRLTTKDLSSSLVRERARNRQSITGLVPLSVEKYISNREVYSDPGEC